MKLCVNKSVRMSRKKVHFLLLIAVVCFTIDESIGYLTDEDIRCLISNDLGNRRPTIIGFSASEVNILNVRVPMGFHHIIPFNVLQRFFIAIMEGTDTELRSQFFNFLARLADIYTLPIPAHNNDAAAIRDLREMLHEQPNVEWIEDPESYRQMIRRLYTWMPFNVFEGPIGEYRDDDPHRDPNHVPNDGFEVNSMRIVGTQIYRDLERLHDNMLLYINRRQNLDGSVAMTRLHTLLGQRNTPFLFNVQDWRMSRETENNPIGHDMFEIIPMDNAANQRKRSVESDITMTREYSCHTDKKCQLKYHFKSANLSDPFCHYSFVHIKEGLHQKLLIFEDDKVWDLEDLHLLQANELLNGTTSLAGSSYADWRKWIESHKVCFFSFFLNILYKKRLKYIFKFLFYFP